MFSFPSPSPLRVRGWLNLFSYCRCGYFANMSRICRAAYSSFGKSSRSHTTGIRALEHRPDPRAQSEHYAQIKNAKIKERSFSARFLPIFHRYYSPFESCEIGMMRRIRVFRINAALKHLTRIFRIKLPC